MFKLFIDGHLADIDEGCGLGVSLSMASLGATEWGRITYAKDVKIPSTPLNQALMGHAHHPLAAQMFNAERHQARVEYDGCLVVEGEVCLTASQVGPEGYYRFDIVGSEREWVYASQAPLSALDMGYQQTLSEQSVVESWEAEGVPVRFMPVERGHWAEIGWQPERRLSLIDYHPFLHLRSIVDAIFAQAGYRVVSKFLGSEWFERLYMSGRWPEPYNIERLVEQNDFVALRTTAAPTTEANYAGRVVADPLANYNTIGNIVEVPDRYIPSEGTKNFNGTLTTDSTGRICFVPNEEMVVAFQCRVRYNTQTRVASRTKLTAFDTIHFDHDSVEQVSFANRYPDRRGSTLSGRQSYNLFIFGPQEGVEYHLYATVAGGAEQRVVVTTEAVTPLVLSTTQSYSNWRLVAASGLNESDAEVDWAIYDGYVDEYNTATVDCTFLTKPEVVSPNLPKYFDQFYFGGADPGMTIEVLQGCEIRPLFLNMPVAGAILGWADVAAFEQSQFELLTSLKKLFDLQFMTDTHSKVVYIEPRGDFYTDEVVDLSDRIDESQGLTITEIGTDATRRIRVAYAQGDRLAEMITASEGAPYGSWTAQVENIYAPNTTTDYVAEMFTPSVEVVGTLSSAPSARLIDVSGAAAIPTKESVEVNFATKLVYYKGVETLPIGEHLVGGVNYYPRLVFFAPAESAAEPAVSLLVEDRNGVEGLNRYWHYRVAMLNRARRIVAHLRLFPEEVEALVGPEGLEHRLRALYKLALGGEEILCRLERIDGYNPQEPSTKCTFVTIV
ncbi:MAG: hypothetical protein E7134_04745 [Rikenellaceae bacterium]|nr:hypothetical protein [Rikenellaceae bacterium]